jgi:FecR protein
MEISLYSARFLVVLLAALCLPAVAQTQDAPPPRVAGTVELVDGNALIEAKDGSARALVVGEDVHEGDTITTFAKSELHLQMADGAQFIVRADSKITLFEYVADGGSEDRSLIDLTRGALRAITGWIGQYNRSNYSIRTPLVTIGVRGTDHEPTHIPIGDPRGEPGSYDKVNEGSAFMQTKQGTVEVPKNRVVFHSASAKGAPQFLQTVPKFFKPGRHEQRFVARAQEARKTLPQRRLQRQEFVRTRSEAGGAKGARPGQEHEAARPGAGKVAPKSGANRAAPRSGAPNAEARPHREVRAPEKAREARSPQNLRRPEHPQQLHKPAAKAHRPSEATR